MKDGGVRAVAERIRSRRQGLLLESKRIVLRAFRRTDFDDVHEYGSDPEVARYMPWGPSSPAETKDFLRRVTDSLNPSLELAIVLRDAAKVIGGVGVHPKSHEIEVGWTLHRAFWRRGLAYEACGLVVDFCWDELGVERLVAMVAKDNVASQRLAEKLGFVREKLLRKSERIRGEWPDQYVYELRSPTVQGQSR